MKPPACESEQCMRTNVPIRKQRLETKTQAPDIQRRINAGWLRLWKTVYPNIPPPTEGQSLKSKVQSPKSKVRSRELAESSGQRSAAVGYLSRFLCIGCVSAVLATGCAGPRPLKGGRAVTTRKPAGIVEQTLVQGENPAQATKQDQESIKVRTFTVPAGSRVE